MSIQYTLLVENKALYLNSLFKYFPVSSNDDAILQQEALNFIQGFLKTENHFLREERNVLGKSYSNKTYSFVKVLVYFSAYYPNIRKNIIDYIQANPDALERYHGKSFDFIEGKKVISLKCFQKEGDSYCCFLPGNRVYHSNDKRDQFTGAKYK